MGTFLKQYPNTGTDIYARKINLTYTYFAYYNLSLTFFITNYVDEE